MTLFFVSGLGAGNLSCQVNEWCVQQGCCDVNYVAASCDCEELSEGVDSKEGSEVKEHDVHKLRNQSRKVVTEPEHFCVTSGFLFCKMPPGVVKRNIYKLRNYISNQA